MTHPNDLTPWRTDILGPGYEQQVIELGEDPDGEGQIGAVLVRRAPDRRAPDRRAPDPHGGAHTDSAHRDQRARGAILYVHGFADYFFQTELADTLAAQGFAFYALDLRKCGRARRPRQHGHYVSNLAMYDRELDRALKIVRLEEPRTPVVVMAHSTGGLVTSLWLDRRRRQRRTAPVAGLVLNSPWLDLQGKPVLRSRAVSWALRTGARLRPFHRLDLPNSIYGSTLHKDARGEWDYDLTLKPHEAFPVTTGWLNAVRRGHATLHRGIEVGVPTLLLHSERSHFSRHYSPASQSSDVVLDVAQIATWAPALGQDVVAAPIAGALHDVFLSAQPVRGQAYKVLSTWLDGVATLTPQQLLG